MNKETALKLLQDNLNAQEWIDQIEAFKKLARTNKPEVLVVTYQAFMTDLRDSLQVEDAKATLILTLALDAYCKLVLEANKPEANKPEAPAQA